MITGKELENREVRGADHVKADMEAMKGRKMKTEGEPVPELSARIAAARKLEPETANMYCRDCWRRGRDAAIREIEGEVSH